MKMMINKQNQIIIIEGNGDVDQHNQITIIERNEDVDQQTQSDHHY